MSGLGFTLANGVLRGENGVLESLFAVSVAWRENVRYFCTRVKEGEIEPMTDVGF